MVFLNGAEFLIYPIDTQESRIRRAAYLMKTHPLFLSVQPDDLINLDPKTNIIAEDLSELINTDAAKGDMDFVSFYNLIKDKFAKTPFNVILYTWLKRIDFNKQDLFKDAIIISIEDAFKGINVQNIADSEMLDQTKNKQRFLQEQAKIEEELGQFNFIRPALMDKIEIQKITFEVQFTIDSDLVEIFDSLRMSRELPYANNGPDRHKIYKEFKNLGEKWESGDINAVQFYVLNTKYPPPKFNEKSYSQGIIELSEKKGEATMAIETLIGSKNNLDDLITRVFNSIQVDRKNIISTQQQSVSSVVNVPKQRFNKYIMNDIITNDPLISSLCYVDESAKIGRIRTGITFFYQPSGADKAITIGFTETIPEMKDYRKSKDMYPLDSRYTRVRINRALNEAITIEVAQFLGKLFTIYNKNKDLIVGEYLKFIKEFVEFEGGDEADGGESKVKGKGNRLRDLVPDLFISGYARKCRYPPVIVDSLIRPDEKGDIGAGKTYVNNPSAEYKQAILFPRTTEEGAQHWYACEKGFYPGLRANVLENSSKYPYFPCCYPHNQTENKKFKNYYLDFDIQETAATSTYILKTPKFLAKGELGKIPRNLELLFQSFASSEERGEPLNFYRTGTSPPSVRSLSSFVDAVALAVGRPVNKRGITDGMFAACRQAGYNMTVDQLSSDFNNSEVYIDPSLYYRALEEYYGCYIYVFTRNEEGGALVYPKHKYTFLRYSRSGGAERPTVIILEHSGSESDASLYPQSEVIISETIGARGVRKSTFTGDFAKRLDDMYVNTITYYSGLSPVKDIIEKDLPNNIISQGIDSMGKTRILVIRYKGNDIFLISQPLPPLVLKEKGSYRNNDESLIKSYIQDEKMNILSVAPDRYIVEKNGIEYQLPYKIITSSTLQTYNQNQRIARYLQEYAYYLYSVYSRDKGINVNNVNSFLKENTIVRAGYVYPKIPRKFSMTSPYLSGNKLIVHSLEMAQRLGYSIEIMIRRYPKILAEYAGYLWIQEYYLDKNDFTPDPNTIIFMTDVALKEWIDESSVEYELFQVPQKDILKLYYLRILDEVYLIQNASSFDNAVYISKTWNSMGYNPKGDMADPDSGYSYYVFESPESIQVEGDSDNKVLVWKEGETLYNGAMLKF